MEIVFKSEDTNNLFYQLADWFLHEIPLSKLDEFNNENGKIFITVHSDFSLQMIEKFCKKFELDIEDIIIFFNNASDQGFTKNISIMKQHDQLKYAFRCSNALQVIVAAKIPARYILVDSDLAEDVCEIYKNYPDMYGEVIVEAKLNDENIRRFGKIGVDCFLAL